MYDILSRISSLVWGSGLIFLLLFTGVLCTVKFGYIQLKMLPALVKAQKKRPAGSGLSQFKTVCMSLGTAMGTGNITGVAAALAVGGPGAVFWMWISAFLGMAVVYAENSLSVIYSDRSARGPMAYISKGLKCPFLAGIFALMCVFAAFGMGGMVQVNSFTENLGAAFHINKYIAAGVVFILIFLVISGGADRIGSAAQALLPAASVIYAAACIAVMIKFHHRIPDALRSVICGAFSIRQTVGGFSGYAVSQAVSVGIRRGIFSNEAGLGSSPILHSAAESSSPHLQGLWSMFEVFFDTMICCSLTAFAILCAAPDLSLNTAFSGVFGRLAPLFLSAETAVFAFCTIIGWYYCGETAYSYLSGHRSSKALPVIYAAVSSLGAILTLRTVWALSDIFNGLMAFPNLLGLLLLINRIKKV